MDSTGNSKQPLEDLTNSELLRLLRQANIDRDDWQAKARVSRNQLQRILRSPSWKITKPFRVINLIAWRFKPELLHDMDDPWAVVRTGKSVWQMVCSQVKVESFNANLAAPKIAILAHWSETETVSASVNLLIDELIENAYEVVLVSACESTEVLKFRNNQQDRITILRKPNYGYDFGSWSVVLSKFPEILDSDEALILNDSNAGPFCSIKEILQQMSESPFDITGATDSPQIRYHIQSYMMHFKNKSLKHEAITSFWQEIYAQEDKDHVIQAYEIGLTSCAQSNGLYVGAILPWNLIVDYWENPSILGAKRLIELGFPFLKREFIKKSTTRELNVIVNLISEKFNRSKSEIKEYL